ncbi:hypothetical protein Goari_004102, partial [Gossypium aridum]|nr:hypothetical protein [Gossypium aridum]
MKFRPRVTTILRNLSCTLPGSLQVILISTSWSLLHLLLRKYTLTWLHSNSMRLSLQRQPVSPFQMMTMMHLN